MKWGGLVVTVLLAALWVASASWYYMSAYQEPQWTSWIPTGETWSVSVQLGVLEISYWKAADFPPELAGLVLLLQVPPSQLWSIPLWTLALIAAIPTAIAWHRDRSSARRLKQGHCPHCAFDLTGLAPNTLCPECGKPRNIRTLPPQAASGGARL